MSVTFTIDMSDLFIRFECPICLDIYHKPIYMCPTGHSLCANCKRKVHKCPSCTKAILDTRNFALENVMEVLQFPCKNNPCPEFLLLDLYTEHLEVCKYKPIICKFQLCTWQGLNDTIYEHIRTVHKSHIVRKDSNILPHQIGQCFIEHEKMMFYVSRHSQKSFVTWSGEATAMIENLQAVLAIKISKPNEDSYALMSHPIIEYREGNSDMAKDSSIVWMLLGKLMDCNIQISVI